jgi:TRAP-type C4-dicarboxylate transport system permease small subunit
VHMPQDKCNPGRGTDLFQEKFMLALFRKIFYALERFLELLAMGMLMAMTAIICYQVTLRYVFNHSPSWSEEIAIVLMIWFGILSIPIGVRLNIHIGIEFIFNKFPLRAQWIISRLIYILIGGFGVIMVVSGTELVEFMMMSTLPATKLPSAVEYVVTPISGLMLIFTVLELLFMPYKDYVAQVRTRFEEPSEVTQ